MIPFNPLSYRSCLAPLEALPKESAWQEHIPFALALVEMVRPRVLVELGVHTGGSYLAFCKAIAGLGLACTCYGVDTFQGDEHTGSYDRYIERDLRILHDPLYGSFSRLLTTTFDDAAQHLAEGSIDLLHIDGLHTYAAVAHDFATWKGKLSERAVVLFHDINVREGDFGVWQLWRELAAQYPHFSFAHGHGLGLLAVGPDVPPGLAPLLELQDDSEVAGRVRDLFFLLGNRLSLKHETRHLLEQIVATGRRLNVVEDTLAHREDELQDLRKQHHTALATIAKLSREVDELAHDLRRVNDSASFRIGMGATAPLRWVAGKLNKS